MSMTAQFDHKKPSLRRDNSGELDVFEAARYFSDYNDSCAPLGGDEKRMTKEERQGYVRKGRVSLDMPSLKQNQYYYNKQYDHQRNHAVVQHDQQQQQQIKENKKHKQPNSPGGKLAHFLNSLFNQTMNSKKKKISPKPPCSTQSLKDEDESPSGRRKRRFSISHFRSTSSVVDSKSIYSSASSGFRTPPPYTLSTPTKYDHKDIDIIKSFNDYKHVLATLSKHKTQEKGHHENVKNEKIKGSKLDWIEENVKVKNNGFVEKTKNYNNNNNHVHQENKSETKVFNEEVDDDDGAESDSSSDLFELQIDYDFRFCSSGLPVYETTHMDNIKRSSTAITNGPIKT